jgi:hypothetical protein
LKVGQNLSAEDVRLIVGVEGDYHSIPEPERTWQPVVDADGVLVGAFDEEVPAGLALLGWSFRSALSKSLYSSLVVPIGEAASPAC